MSLRFHAGVLAAGIVLVAAPLAAPAQGAGADEAKSRISMCTGCHGISGYKTAYPVVYHVPKIGGQSPVYLANALKAYRSGERGHPSMRGIAASLSDKDIEVLAAYYGRAAK
jgi:cytochrome c553